MKFFGMLVLALVCCLPPVFARDIRFCGELIPLSNDFVANRLMQVIRRQLPTANLPALRQKALFYFPYIEACLRSYGIPEDFKYLPIVESGFTNAASVAGARGFWQLMPATAREFRLRVSVEADERDDLQKSTHAACKLILRDHALIKKQLRAPSWVLTAAAYNTGVGRVLKAISRQGPDYFSMQLHAETAEYVYKIIAIKELFERPELYMRSLGGNVFRLGSIPLNVEAEVSVPADQVSPEFRTIAVRKAAPADTVAPAYSLVPARLHTAVRDLRDGSRVKLVLEQDLQAGGFFARRGNVIPGTAWLIDGRVQIDLGYGHAVQVLDALMVKGLLPEALREKGAYVVLKAESPES